MNYKNFIKFTVAVLSVMTISVLLHELVHVLQLHYIIDVPFKDMEIRYFWQYDTSGQNLIETLTEYRLAWVVCPECTTTKYINTKLYEFTAYTIQFTFVAIVYFKFIYKNKAFYWR